MELDSNVRELLNIINDQGYEAYLVGGAVRDALLGVPNNDFDICTNMPLSLIKEIFPKFIMMKPNSRRITGILKINGKEIEISEFKGSNILEDLSNRDFSVNAIAATKEGKIIDPFNGIESLNKREITLVDQTGKSLEYDPLRILRAIRIASKMNFIIDKRCLQLMKAKSPLLKEIKVERIYKELIQILATDNPSFYIQESKEIFFEILPELKEVECTYIKKEYFEGNLFDYTLKSLSNCDNNIIIRLACLLQGLKIINKEDEITELETRLKISNKTKKEIEKLMNFYNYNIKNSEESIYEFIQKYGVINLNLFFELKKANILAEKPEYLYRLEEIEHIQNTCQQIANSNPCLSVRKLMISPKMLHKKGVPKNKINQVQKEIMIEIIFKGLPNEKEILEKYIQKNKKKLLK